MLGGDLMVAQRQPNGVSWRASDYFSTTFQRPTLDALQNVTLLSAAWVANTTYVELQRPLDPCGDEQDRPILYDTMQTVVFAHGRTASLSYHGPENRGSLQLRLNPARSRVAAEAAAPPAGTLREYELRMPNFTVPTDATTYQCVNLELPYTLTKQHVYKWAPVVASPLLHHFIVYACTRNPDRIGVPYECQYGSKPPSCLRFWLGWAPGLGETYAPEEAALAFGAGTLRYVTLEVHYSNYEGVPAQVDSSGARLFHSSVLKKYDMAVLELGSEVIAVPPDASWSTKAVPCPAACTARWLSRPTTVVASFYHMHALGRSMITRHVRDGVELPPLGRRDYFDFGFQTLVEVPANARTLLPGDSLVTQCSYSGAGRTNTTEYGLSSRDEMCYNFLYYYPAVEGFEKCTEIYPDVVTCSSQQTYYATPEDAAGVGKAFQDGNLMYVPGDLPYEPYTRQCHADTLAPSQPPFPPSSRPPSPAASPSPKPSASPSPSSAAPSRNSPGRKVQPGGGAGAKHSPPPHKRSSSPTPGFVRRPPSRQLLLEHAT
ncbi:hypothetical protein HXX76_005135 [Chlamydomonas incerta]|uniref:DOMON domain-containing protein n=1 Tax=Chlamydomonas incerta TaxID=51695 RepID=A0A835TH25_CHLIN|nr:hypothetical protein HXX76_005135 [Chlamydomonas incerta]|eukprot:KAG2438585.1 hypothetical protein HXX76_005135 [Chlamydomonas incerta]